MGGTNAHIVLKEAPKQVESRSPLDPLIQGGREGDRKGNGREIENSKAKVKSERSVHILTLSGKTEQALAELVHNYITYLESHREAEIADICFTANAGRKHFNHRLAVITSSKEELLEQLQTFGKPLDINNSIEPLKIHSLKAASTKQIAFIFTGQGFQCIDMGRQLYETQPTFRENLDKCDRILRSYLDISLLEVLYPNLDNQKQETLSPSLIDQTSYTQPAIFAIEYALA